MVREYVPTQNDHGQWVLQNIKRAWLVSIEKQITIMVIEYGKPQNDQVRKYVQTQNNHGQWVLQNIKRAWLVSIEKHITNMVSEYSKTQNEHG